MGSELHMLEFGLYGTRFGQAASKILLDLSNKGAIESNSYYIKIALHCVTEGDCFGSSGTVWCTRMCTQSKSSSLPESLRALQRAIFSYSIPEPIALFTCAVMQRAAYSIHKPRATISLSLCLRLSLFLCCSAASSLQSFLFKKKRSRLLVPSLFAPGFGLFSFSTTTTNNN